MAKAEQRTLSSSGAKVAAARAEISNEANAHSRGFKKRLMNGRARRTPQPPKDWKSDLPGWVAPKLEQVTHDFTDRIAEAGAAQIAQSGPASI